MTASRIAVPSLAFVLLAFAPAFAQKSPNGTVVTGKHADGSTEVQPDFKKARISDNDIIDAQKKLNDEGYNAGTPDGKLGPHTRAAIRKFQQDKNLTVTGKLDESTLSHLNVAPGKTMANAPSDIGRGAKAAGHDFKEGHPLAAAKAIGKGFGHAGKSVALGTKSGVMGSKDKIANKSKSKDSSQTPR
ncbi:MAG: peptidoglycan-binding protein [Acidobacteria bacterium]|nr:peptidoglycan-binding protein [Acidobacteriota bacterium]MBV9436249.1 peptidoglycan-binding protein [Acidobacteriota bacterium]